MKGGEEGAYSRGVLICYFGREGGRLFEGGRLLERERLFKEIRYILVPRNAHCNAEYITVKPVHAFTSLTA